MAVDGVDAAFWCVFFTASRHPFRSALIRSYIMPRLLLTNRFLWFSGPSCFYYAAASSASLLAASPLGTTVLALKILQEDLHVHEQSHPILTPVPSAEFVFGAIDRECARRAFWLIRFMHLTAFTYYYVPIPPAQLDLTLRLPVDETSFELAVHSTLSGEFCLAVFNCSGL